MNKSPKKKQLSVSTTKAVTGAYAAFCEEVGYPPRIREKAPLVQTCKKCNSPSAMPVCHRCKLLRLKRFTGIAKHNAVNRIHWSQQEV